MCKFSNMNRYIIVNAIHICGVILKIINMITYTSQFSLISALYSKKNNFGE